jgi:hypothetical protein
MKRAKVETEIRTLAKFVGAIGKETGASKDTVYRWIKTMKDLETCLGADELDKLNRFTLRDHRNRATWPAIMSG